MRKILNIMTAANMGGISSTMLNFYKNLNEHIHMDLAITSNEVGINGKKFVEYGSKIYYLPKKSRHPIKYCKELYKLLIDGNYDVIHVNENFTSYVALAVAKKAGIKIRIAHAHTFIKKKNPIFLFRRMLSRVLSNHYATTLVACSSEAGKSMFGKSKKMITINNGVNINKYKFDLSIRNKLREEFNISEDAFIVGTVGRLSKEKNQEEIIEIFSELLKKQPNSVLIMVGDGPEKEKLIDLICKKNIEKSVLMLGLRSDVVDLLNVFDVFLLTSFYEGFPVSVAEALANGLECLISSTLTKDLSCFLGVHYIKRDCINDWLEVISHICKKNRTENVKENYNGTIIDVKYNSNMLLDIYNKKY